MTTATLAKPAAVDLQMVFDLLGRQGNWTEKEYLDLTESLNTGLSIPRRSAFWSWG